MLAAMVLLAAALAVAALFGWLGSPLPDIVVVTLDTTRADRLGAYGYFRDTSPYFDQLAAESVLFEEHYVPMAHTLPTHTSLFTGVYPLEHGVQANAVAGSRYLPAPGLTYVAEYLSSLGYDTAGFVSAWPLKTGSGVERGMARFHEPPRREVRAGETTDHALEWLAERDPSKPMFLWVHYFDPHQPYAPPEGYKGRFKKSDLQVAHMEERHFFDHHRVGRASVIGRSSRYDEEILYMDSQLGRLLDTLRSRQQWSDTVVVVVSDHGEGLNQHGQMGHEEVWDESVRAPLLIRIPRTHPGRVDGPVNTVDVFPTVFARLRLPGRETWLAQLSGRNVWKGGDPSRPMLFQSPLRSPKNDRRKWGLMRGSWKYVDFLGDHQLYDRASDPWEVHDVAAHHPERMEAMRDELQTIRAEQIARRQTFGGGERVPEQEHVLEALEALGYMVRDP
jgi:arylsulfatase A-like enzyme